MNFAAGEQDFHIYDLQFTIYAPQADGRVNRKLYIVNNSGHAVMRSVFRYGCKASGILTLPSACWCVSISATNSRASAVPLPLRMCGNLFSPLSVLKRRFIRRAWKSSQFEQLETSR